MISSCLYSKREPQGEKYRYISPNLSSLLDEETQRASPLSLGVPTAALMLFNTTFLGSSLLWAFSTPDHLGRYRCSNFSISSWCWDVRLAELNFTHSLKQVHTHKKVESQVEIKFLALLMGRLRNPQSIGLSGGAGVEEVAWASGQRGLLLLL